METLFMVFMAFAASVCIFAVVVVLRDVIRDIADSRKEKKAAEAPCEQAPQEEPAPAEPAVAEPAVAEPAPAEELVESVAVAEEPVPESEEGKIS